MQAGIFLGELELCRGLDYASRMSKPILAQNIAALRHSLGMNQTQFAAAIGTQQANISKWEKGATAPEGDNLSALAELAGVSEREFRDLDWVPKAGGARGPNGRPLDLKRAPEQFPTRGAYDDVGAVKLKCLNLELAMGEGTDLAEWFEETEVSFDANWLSAISPAPFERLIIGRGVGDSMRPTIGDQDDVLIDLDQNELKRADRVYAITIDGAGAVKRLMPSPEKGMIEVVSDNPDHPARVRTYPKAMIRIIGRVVWSGRRH
ncbi:Peptidase S24-like [Sphingopyxis flava]|uniref:Peptidase S24-like n=2 Tax=Sphingopyxis flava TaxID=1507287 RepID=A0A1T4ZX42_9SPHN|nr:Peptidase S24-like [Sphingopyxis flava]